MDKRVGTKILIDVCNRDAFSLAGFKEWFQAEYEHYDVDEMALKDMKTQTLKDTKILIIMGSWCGDSRREVPRFYKILDQLEINSDNVTLVNVDTYKKAKRFDVDKYNIQRVPTFIFLNKKNGEEIGRIIERPRVSLEKDLVEILK